MPSVDGLKIARRRIAKEAKAQTGRLNLDGLGLSQLPTELMGLPHLTSLVLGYSFYVSGISDLTPLARLKRLQVLYCGACPVTDLSPLAELSDLRHLDFGNTQVTDVSPLSKLKSLRYISCGNRVADLTPLAELNCVQYLRCGGQVTDLSPLSKLNSLRHLNCMNAPVTDLSPLGDLKGLRILDCGTQMTDLSPLAELKRLRHLNCRCAPVTDLSPLGELKGLRILHCGRQVTDLSPLAGLQKLKRLDCSSNTRLTDLSPLAELKSFKRLDCSSTRVTDLSPLAGLQKLKRLDCSSTRVTDLGPLAGLQKLKRLECGWGPVCNLSPLENLRCLKRLDCSYTRVTDLSPLAGLQKLKRLDCGSCPVRNLSPLEDLRCLKRLDCSRNPVRNLIPLSNVKSLKVLDCSGVRVRDLLPLAKLKRLTRLDCGFARVVQDLGPLAKLKRLKELACCGTKVNDLNPLVKLTRLQVLDCSDTRVSDLTPLAKLKRLKQLDCCRTKVSDLTPLIQTPVHAINASGCHLQTLPAGLLNHHTLKSLQLFGSSVVGAPSEVLSQDEGHNCLSLVRHHFADLSAGGEPAPDAKLVVLGNGRIGKTQICRRLRNKGYDDTVSSTHGIMVTQCVLPIAGERDAVLSLWDFGGQDLYHGTHALFMKTRAVFLVVWVPQSESSEDYLYNGIRFRNQPLPYWLDYVRTVASSDCPVIVLQNQCEAASDEVAEPPAEPDQLLLRYTQAQHYSAKTDRKRESLNEAIREAVKQLRGSTGVSIIGIGRVKVWKQILAWIDSDSRRSLDKRQHRTLSVERFESLCAQIGDITSSEDLLEYLHNAGVVFYRKGLFQEQIILDQSWALDAIYSIFHQKNSYRPLKELNGRFTRSLLDTLVWKVFSKSEQELLLSLMKSCGICFVHRLFRSADSVEWEYVAPDLLPDRDSVESDLAGRWNDDGNIVERRWTYPFLNRNLLRSILSRIGSLARETAVYWKNGVWTWEADHAVCGASRTTHAGQS